MHHPYSERIRSIRAEHGLGQAMLGRMVGVTAKSVVRWEQGRVIEYENSGKRSAG